MTRSYFDEVDEAYDKLCDSLYERFYQKAISEGKTPQEAFHEAAKKEKEYNDSYPEKKYGC